jgi:hypothetical protein
VIATSSGAAVALGGGVSTPGNALSDYIGGRGRPAVPVRIGDESIIASQTRRSPTVRSESVATSLRRSSSSWELESVEPGRSLQSDYLQEARCGSTPLIARTGTATTCFRA